MNFWSWLNTNAGALQGLFAMVSALLTAVTIGVLIVTWKAIRTQAMEARALTEVARRQTEVAIQQTEVIARQSEAALQSAAATEAANRISEEANRLTVEQIRVDLRPILIFDSIFYPEQKMSRDAIKNVGRGPAKDVQISIGTAKDELPKGYISSRTLIGSGDAAFLSINQQMFAQTGMTIHYASLDGRRFVTSIYMRENAIKHDFEELKS
jgi:hypothetical protein